jgi:glycosyltransferase involved in cell wall biosynthesis
VTHRAICRWTTRLLSPCSASNPGDSVNSSNTRNTPRVSVVIPTYNEARNIPIVFSLLPDAFEVIAVDGRSTDGTVEVARQHRPDVRIVFQTRKGKGNALACGFAAARGDIIVMLDADGSADPREIPRFVRALTEGADFAKGTRFVAGGGSGDITRLRRYGNKGLNALVNAVYGTKYSDLCYGYNAFWTHCLPVFNLEEGVSGTGMTWGDGFEFETLINVRAAQARLRVVEVPSYEAVRIHGESNLNAVRDGFRVLRTIAVELRSRGLAPAPNSMLSILPLPTEKIPSESSSVIDLRSSESVTRTLSPSAKCRLAMR